MPLVFHGRASNSAKLLQGWQFFPGIFVSKSEFIPTYCGSNDLKVHIYKHTSHISMQ